VDDDFPRLFALACHDLRTPLATVSGFAKTMLRIEELEPDKQARYLGLIDNSADELASLLDLLSLAARIEGGRYEPVLREVDSFSLAPEGATGTGATVLVDPEPVERALAAF
jgi:signal transduction histidine kinase